MHDPLRLGSRYPAGVFDRRISSRRQPINVLPLKRLDLTRSKSPVERKRCGHVREQPSRFLFRLLKQPVLFLIRNRVANGWFGVLENVVIILQPVQSGDIGNTSV